MKWFRLYHEILDDPKVQRLEPGLFKFWVNFLCLANQGTPRGTVAKSLEEIAFSLRISDDEAARSLDELRRAGLIETVDDRYLKPHGWDDRQRKSDDVTARVTAHRGGRNATAPPPPMLPETDPATLGATDAETLQETASETLDETLHPTLPETEIPSRATEQELEQETEQEENPPEGPPDGADAPAQAQGGAQRRRRRIDENFTPSMALLGWARENLTLDEPTIRRETEKFTDHFRAKGDTKLDWAAAWRNWMRRVEEGAYGRVSPGHSPSPPVQVWPDRPLETDEEFAAAEARWLGREGTTP